MREILGFHRKFAAGALRSCTVGIFPQMFGEGTAPASVEGSPYEWELNALLMR